MKNKITLFTALLIACSVAFGGTTVTDKLKLKQNGTIEAEGATNDEFETTLEFTDPTADRTITFKDADGTVAFLSDIGCGAVTGSGTVGKLPKWCGSGSNLGDSIIREAAGDIYLDDASPNTIFGCNLGTNRLRFETGQIGIYISGGNGVELTSNVFRLRNCLDALWLGCNDSDVDLVFWRDGHSYTFETPDPSTVGPQTFVLPEASGTMAVANCLSSDTLTLATSTEGELVDSMFSQNGAGTLGSICNNGLELGYIQSSATAQNFIDLRNSNQYSYRLGNHVSYVQTIGQYNMVAPSGSDFALQLLGVACDRPELVFSKNDNSWQARIKSDYLTDQQNHFLPDTTGTIAVVNECVTDVSRLLMTSATCGELIDAPLSVESFHVRTDNGIGIRFYDGDGDYMFVNYNTSGSGGRQVALPDLPNFEGSPVFRHLASINTGSSVIPMSTNAGGELAHAYSASIENLSESGGNIDWDTEEGGTGKITLDGNHNFNAPTNLTPSMEYVLVITQDGIGSRIPTWDAIFKFSGGTPPTLTTTPAAKDMIWFHYDGTGLNFKGITTDLQ